MGRNSTGAVTTSECLRITLGNLLKNGLLKKDCKKALLLSWAETRYGSEAGSVYVLSDFTGEEKYIKIIYGLQDTETGKKKIISCKVFIDAAPSTTGRKAK